MRSSDVLGRNFQLYRELSLALQDKVTRLKADKDTDPDCKNTLEAVKAHQRALQTVLELEASLVKRSRSWTDGGGVELDVGAARAEIRARLAAWTGER